jgi:carbonic anhydrase/acetyltransferase-like protein (isoleucine patch superfamily)
MIRSYHGKTPQIATSAYIDPAATVTGDVTIGEDSSIWPGAVLRGDVHSIRLGKCTNVQDNAIVHGSRDRFPVIVGDNVSVGHGALIHGCTIESRCLIGVAAIVLNNARIGTGSIVAAGTLVPEGRVVPPGSFFIGHPGKLRRQLTPDEQATIDRIALQYIEYKNEYKGSG